MNNQIIEKAIKIAGGQVQLAAKAGISQTAVHKLLTRKSMGMRVRTAISLAKATGIPIEDFIKYEESLMIPDNPK
ncbi:MAG: YdaS family helix-turn-helix protein [Methylococcaceae bacterium]|jgi:transcriptional regulator with XRE-family HTH domain